jgi:Tol biopolymer transport system component
MPVAPKSALLRVTTLAASVAASAAFALPAHAAFPGDNGAIAYTGPADPSCLVRDPSCGTAVYSVDANGSNPHRLMGDVQRPSWSPFGSELLVQYDNPQNLTSSTDLLRSSGAVEAAALTSGGADTGPVFSGDARSVFFERNGGIARASRHGFAPPVQVLRNAAAPTVSSTNRLAFVRGGDIYTSDLRGRHVRRLTRTRVREGAPNWGPYGDWLVYTRGKTGSRQIWDMPADGAWQERLTHGADDAGAAYSPDGGQIVFSRYAHLMVMDGDGENVHQIARQGLDPDWQPVR